MINPNSERMLNPSPTPPPPSIHIYNEIKKQINKRMETIMTEIGSLKRGIDIKIGDQSS